MLIKQIISDYRGIISRDGNVTEAELKRMLLLDEGIKEKEKTEEGIKDLIEKINKKEYRKMLATEKKQAIHDKRMKLYLDGLSDEEIAITEKVNYSTIWRWRNINCLPANDFLLDDYEKKMWKLYYEHFSDAEIAKQTYTSITYVFNWRKRNNLKSINKKTANGKVKNE